jgi:hypothetical protein
MSSHPLILTAAEVRAVLNGTKTQHRVRVKFTRPPPWQIMDESDDGQPWPFYQDEFGDYHPMRCPFGTPGDTLYVKEAHAWVDYLVGSELEDPVCVAFKADQTAYSFAGNKPVRLDTFAWPWDRIKWRSPATMPRWASRLTLEVESVRVQRLQDISEEDARVSGLEDLESDRAQGIIDTPDWSVCEQCGGTRLYTSLGPNLGACFDTDCLECDTYRKRFRNAWRFKHGADSWSRNDWVFALTFKRAEGER